MHQPPSVKNNTCIVLGTLKSNHDHNLCLCVLMSQIELAEKDSQLNDLKANIKTQQSETSKAKSELKSALETIEQLKQNFNSEKSGQETDKAALLKRAEEVETALKPVTGELSGLKQQINIMSSTIFGKNISLLCCLNHIRNVFWLTHNFIDTGSQSAKLGSDMRIRLKAVYSLVEQLYTGA